MLTSELLSSFESGVSYVRRRVKVYSAGGNQICFARLGEGDERLKFPGHWIIGHALQDPDWARFSTAEELAEDPTLPVPMTCGKFRVHLRQVPSLKIASSNKNRSSDGTR